MSKKTRKPTKPSRFPRRPLSKNSPYYLPPLREREIIYFCFQYKDWKKRLNEISFKGTNSEWSDPTAKEAIERVVLQNKIQTIEEACKQTYHAEWELLLEGITDPDSSWYNYYLMKGILCPCKKYYSYKHMVYYLISEKDNVANYSRIKHSL